MNLTARGKINIHPTFSTIIEELEGGSKLVFIHQNADVDAIGSAIAVCLAFPDCTICTHQSVSALSKIVLKELGFEVLIDPEPEVIANFNKYLILDTSSPAQLGWLVDDIKDPIVIDHHTSTDNWDGRSKIYYCDESKSSCGEIIYELLQAAGKEIDKTTAIALLSAIITDTGRFKFANNETLSTFTEILSKSGLDIGQILEMVDSENNNEHSQKIAHLKSAQRLKFESVKSVIIASSVVGAFESSSCKNLLVLGADVAFVGSQQGTELRLNAKTKPFLIDQGLHLGKFMDQVGKECGCEGGGHAGVAGLNGKGDVEAVLNICVGKVKEWLLRK